MHVHGIDKTNTIRAGGHDEGVGPVSFAEEADPAQKSSVGYSAGGKDDVAAKGQISGRINTVRVFDAHFGNALFELGRVNHQASYHFAVQAAHGRSGNHAL